MSLKRFLRDVYDRVHVCSSDVQTLNTAVQDGVSSIIKAISKKDERFTDLSLLQCGSTAEGSKVWEHDGSVRKVELEYDFLAVLETPEDGFTLSNAEKSSNAKLSIKETETSNFVDFADSQSADRLFTELVSMCLHKCESGVSCESAGVLRPDGRDSLSYPYTFLWKPKNGKAARLRIDILLAFDCDKIGNLKEFVFRNVKPRLRYKVLQEKLYLVPKSCGEETCFACWRVSTCSFEVKKFLGLSPVHKKCYVVLKFLLLKFFGDKRLNLPSLSSYKLKTVLFYHSDRCKVENMSLTNCCVGILGYLHTCHSKGTLCHYVFKSCNLFREAYIQSDEFKLEGDYIRHLKTSLQKLDKSENVKYDFDKVLFELKDSVQKLCSQSNLLL